MGRREQCQRFNFASNFQNIVFLLIGGRWLVTVDKQKHAQKLDTYWLELMMAIVGEQFEEYGDHICGAVVNLRQKGDKV